MKTAISIPDALFEQAEAAAKELSLSRSELYARAVEAFLKARSTADTTAALNAIYAHEPSRLDPLLAQLQSNSLPPEKW